MRYSSVADTQQGGKKELRLINKHVSLDRD